ncbi:FAD-binding oxidoreductase [Brevirhabdus pacifica]|uniref:D-2-hydroxyglutarate dehydrogenase n=4 Tax=Brevirhabdus pacifica TaxID=1267768 RepID=A0A1U7DLN0_9RHOB|nr:FAD-binding and (Fe-S)-binding domain-containing protein [Brevirhabdus pacifica]APX90881.1 FAD-binding oxidoreductase [Brevirhabdus pacifica]OWU80311.1 lactate dehydrogenase [Loktanella sp. 22II-4b]PJJ87083.1 FAD/FMN-containing dehydrogenase [Brevirhabdus pacifica]
MLDETARARLRRDIEGEVHFDAFTRGRYATDASIYQIMPAGVVIPRHDRDVAAALDMARGMNLPLTMRGGGTSQCGQTVNHGLIVDCSRHLTGLLELDVAGRRAVVEPGIVLDELNRLLKPHGLWFPVDISTGSRATLGGMVGNNSCGSRSLRYGTTRDNVLSLSGLLADGSAFDFGALDPDRLPGDRHSGMVEHLLDLGRREAGEIEARFPKVQRRVGGYNIDALVPPADGAGPVNLAHLLIGSEGTLAITTRIEIRLSPLPSSEKVLGVCHFPDFRSAMEAARHLVALGPTSVELVDATMIGLARSIPMFARTLDAFVRGTPAALLLVEFAEGAEENRRRVTALHDTMADLGFGFGKGGPAEGGVVEVHDPALAADIAELRKAGLNIMMSMKEAGKPVSFVEDCAVPLEHLADYTDRLTAIFRAHGTEGTWYAHASEGCLHVRPVLNLKLDQDVRKMRAIAEAAFDMVREFKGSHSGEHGDGIVRSEFHTKMFGQPIVKAFEEVKRTFDPEGRLNPGKITAAPPMDDRSLMRYPPGYAVAEIATGHDWSAWTGAGGGLQGAVEMCNNNGACRKLKGGVMCPSYRVTRNERDVTRGRANTLRLALSGQLGRDALFSDEMAETLKLCVGCKACQRECPTGVDMARMKTEVLYQRSKRMGVKPRDRLIAELPRMGRLGVALGGLVRLRNRLPLLARAGEGLLGLARARSLPVFRRDHFRDADVSAAAPAPTDAPTDAPAGELVLFVDTFGRWMEPELPRAALKVLRAAGYVVHAATPEGGRPLCCGRTYLAAGMIDRARDEARRTLRALLPHIRAGRPIVGLEPSCLLTLRDEFLTLLPGEEAEALAGGALLFEEFVAREAEAGRFRLPLRQDAPRRVAHIHGHCHQKAAGTMAAVKTAAEVVPGVEARIIDSGCCGMAGAFGYGAETFEVSRRMAELDLLPAVRAADEADLLIAAGTSCRHQIADGTERRARHLAEVMADLLAEAPETTGPGATDPGE